MDLHHAEKTQELTATVAAEVRAWCARQNVSQRSLAKVLGISQSSMSYRYSGRTPFTFGELMAIASILGITLGQLLGSDLVNEKDPQHIAEGLDLVAVPGLDPGTSRL
ncbi:helix-turn-helix domain-containing protein [Glutamicibacter uratoxydans]|uniref:helix-turn-helix domain-containing protein n=1 Tax=Glutamicibacter uratoxydans TaxID=43667 RepID=UPI0011413A4E